MKYRDIIVTGPHIRRLVTPTEKNESERQLTYSLRFRDILKTIA